MRSYLIGFSGPSASGKSTLCSEVIRQIDNSVLISLDDYWKDPSTFPIVHGYKNWELPENLKLGMLFQNLQDLRSGLQTRMPNFVDYKYEGLKTVRPSDFVLAEGFLLFHDKRISDLFDLKFYLDVPEKVIIERRLNRNRSEKSKEPYYRRVVVKEYRSHGPIQKARSDIILDGTEDSYVNTEKIVDIIRNLS
ncbi:hypothetical protein HQ533_03815 [Candidatus Woesearchaeota archaeon]|nr:hypothetical protein [Candidatus Woesearchaeota archaeon]